MTQEQLAMLLGVSRQSVTKWEAERSYPEMDKLLKMCRIFDCSLDDLVQGDLTKEREGNEGAQAKAMPAGPPQDICGYDEHQRKMAWRVPSGVACILVGIAFGFFFEGTLSPFSHNGHDGAVCGAIMIAATIIGLALLFAPVLASPDPSNFKPEGTSAMWFWAAWPVGGMVCGIISLLWEAFGKEER